MRELFNKYINSDDDLVYEKLFDYAYARFRFTNYIEYMKSTLNESKIILLNKIIGALNTSFE